MKNNDIYIYIEPLFNENNNNLMDNENLPLVSFLIPVLNSERTLDKCLKSIIEQDYPNIEIIIIDNGSSDNTLNIARQFTKNIYYDNGLLGSVRQTGLDNMKGSIAGIFDSDVYLPHKQWLSHAMCYFNYSEEVATIWPKMIAPLSGPLFQKLYFNLAYLIIEDRIYKNRGVMGGGGALIKKVAIDETGGYNRNVHWGEDFDLALKLKNKGYKIIYLKDAVYHDTDMGLSITQFLKKQITGAISLSINSKDTMHLSKKDLIYENCYLGIKGMIFGLTKEKDISWFLFPLLIILRIFIFIYISIFTIKGKRIHGEIK